MGINILSGNSVGRANLPKGKTPGVGAVNTGTGLRPHEADYIKYKTGLYTGKIGVPASQTTGNNASGSGSSKSSAGVKQTAGTGGTNYQQYLASLYANQKSQAQALADSQRAAAQNAYNLAKGNLEKIFDVKTGALSDNLKSTLDNLRRQYNTSKKEVRTDANNAMREAYVNHMMNKKNLNQNLSAQGIGGGAAESTMAGMYNNYGNSRNDIANTLNNNLTSLNNTYQGNIASAQQQYDTAYANALADYLTMQNQIEQNLANNVIGSYDSMYQTLGDIDSGYNDALMQLLQKQGSLEFATPVNSLEAEKVTTETINNMGTVTDAAKQRIAELRSQGMSEEDIMKQMFHTEGIPRDVIYQLFG